jgi:hypothetical protein
LTIALCLSCGSEKFGAFVACPQCGTEVVESHDLAIAFSDHHLSHDEIVGFGAGLMALNVAQGPSAPGDNKALFVRLFAFLEWVGRFRSDVLSASAPPALRADVDALVAATTMPLPPPVLIGAHAQTRKHK